ncbi:hypothetical protein GCM10027190_09060 [Spirosoma areae]
MVFAGSECDKQGENAKPKRESGFHKASGEMVNLFIHVSVNRTRGKKVSHCKKKKGYIFLE